MTKLLALLLAGALLLAACQTPSPTAGLPPDATDWYASPTALPVATRASGSQPASNNPGLNNLIPMPVSVKAGSGTFTLGPDAMICVEPGFDEILEVGRYLAERLKPATGYALPVLETNGAPARGNLYLTVLSGDSALGDEGYELSITTDGVTLSANQPAGLFYGIQTLRQLFPASIESQYLRPGPWTLLVGKIRDQPRFAWRGAMLDVARHFFSVQDVKRYIDLIAAYKINRLHLHLTDDQGWRIMIDSWPRLATYGGSTAVGGGSGGYYTQSEYAEIVTYAQSRFISVVPEIDMPGHINAALASYPKLNCNGTVPTLYTGTEVGFSSLCLENESSYQFVEQVLVELAELTPGPYLHIGGDEASATTEKEYISFINRIQAMVQKLGKQAVGWEEIAQASVLESTIIQHWNSDIAAQATRNGVKIIMSPASRVYLDMKYDPSTKLGYDWAGYSDVEDAYTWEPASLIKGVAEGDILGVEAPLWSETLLTMDDIEYMAFPRLIGIAEIGWSPAIGRSWDEYKMRLGAQGPRLALMGINYYASPQVPWQTTASQP